MLTGGFRTVSIMENAIKQNKLDHVGLARPFTLYPDLANQMFEGNLMKIDIPSPTTGFKFLDSSGFVDIKWHEMQIHLLGKNKKPNTNLNPKLVIIYNMKETFKKLMTKKLKW